MTTRRFWPLDFDPEGEIYENLAWDLPGYQRPARRQSANGRGADGKVRPIPRRSDS